MKIFNTADLKKDAFPNMPEDFKKRVELTLANLPEKKGEIIMEKGASKHSVRKVVILAAAAVMILGTTVFAAGKVSQYTSSGSNSPAYKEMPDIEQVEKDYGFKPLLIKGFSNGYEFHAAYGSDTKALDENNNTVETYKDLDFEYVKDDDEINLDVNNSKSEMEDSLEEKQGEKSEISGVEICYLSYVNKCVPVDYEMTEEDKAAEASGEVIFSCGSDDIFVQTIQSVSFHKDGINYVLFYSGENLTKEDLISMTGELLTAE